MRRAIDRHNAKTLDREDAEALPPGPDLTKRGHPFKAREHDGEVWVAVRGSIAKQRAQAYVDDRRRMLVLIDRERWAMVPARVDVDHERQQVHVVAARDSLAPW